MVDAEETRESANNSTVYGVKISVELLSRADTIARFLGLDSRLYPSGQCSRADVIRRAITIGLDKLDSELVELELSLRAGK